MNNIIPKIPILCACGCGETIILTLRHRYNKIPQYKRGHYSRISRTKEEYENRFWGFVDIKTEDECWNWTRSTNNTGYGSFFYISKQTEAHRVAWIIKNGDIPDGLFVLHKCDNKLCVNPSHLFLGTAKDNTQDMVIKGRSCKGQKNGNAQLTEDQVRSIRLEYKNYGDGKSILNKYGISYTNLSNIIHRKRWGWLQ